MLGPIMEDPDYSPDLRGWVFQLYGTGSRSLWTIFEFTLSGGWPTYARRVVEEVHWAYAIFFSVYVWVVVFAVTRLITALFVNDTMKVAQQDSERMMREAQANKDRYVGKLHEVFAVADVNQDGSISQDEFEEILRLP